MEAEIWVNFGSGRSGLLPDGTKPLPKPMLTYYRWDPMALSLEDLKIPFNKTRLKISCLKWRPDLQMANTLSIMMTASNGNISRVTGHLCGEFTGHRWIHRSKASDAELWCFSLICAWINSWINNGAAGELRLHCAYYDVTVMIASILIAFWLALALNLMLQAGVLAVLVWRTNWEEQIQKVCTEKYPTVKPVYI